MPTKQEMLIEADKRGLLTGEKKQAFDAAVQRGLITLPSQPSPQSMTAEQFQADRGDIPDIYGEIIPQEPKPEHTMGEKALGLAEAGLTTATGAVGGTLGMMGGTLQGIITELRSGEFGSNEAANRIADRAEAAMAEFTYMPRTEAGQEYVGEIGEAGAQLAPLAGLGGPVAQMGQLAKASAPQVASVAGKAAAVAKPTKDVAKSAFTYQSPAKQKIAQLIESGVPDKDTAQYRVTTPSSAKPESRILQALNAGGAKVAKDKIAIGAIDQGFDEGVIAAIKTASKTDKRDMVKMLNIFEEGKNNQLFGAKNRPTDVIGDRVLHTFNVVKKANKTAGSDVDKAARSLKGLQVDSAPIGKQFVGDLADMGIGVSDDMKLVFKGSDVEDLSNVERTLSTVFRRMTGDKAPDAYELHRMKRFIDEQVSYGKMGDGLTGKSEAVLKSLRRNIDGALDKKFKHYDEANTMYSDTIQALDDIQTVAGKRMDLSGDNANKALGTLMKRVLGNAQSRVNVIDALSSLDDTAKKYPAMRAIEGGNKGGAAPDLTQLILFADELDARFKPVARGSIQGQMEQVANRGRQMATGSPTMAAVDAVVGAAARGLDKVKGISDDKAFQAMRKLLNRGDE